MYVQLAANLKSSASPEVTAAVIAAAASLVTLVGSIVAQAIGFRLTARDTEKSLSASGAQLDRTLAEQRDSLDRTFAEQRDSLDRTLAEQRDSLDRTLAEQRARALNERFATAAGMMGSDRPAAVRLAGVHAMAGLADDWEENRQTCVDVLCAYLRMPYQPDPGEQAPLSERLDFGASQQVRHTVIRVITAHLNETTQVSWSALNLDFTGARFDGGDFRNAAFPGRVSFSGATFAGDVSFEYASFSGAVDFSGAEFSGGTVNFRSAKFTGMVDFWSTNFSGGRADFTFSHFADGDTRFGFAKFSSGLVQFDFAEFSGSCVTFMHAQFCGGGVSFRRAEFLAGEVSFKKANFSDGSISFEEAQFSGAQVDFLEATFSAKKVWYPPGETAPVVDLSSPGSWSAPPAFSFVTTPAGLALPESWTP